MMRHILYSFLLSLIVAVNIPAQAQNRCATEDEFQQQAAKDPSLLKAREEANAKIADYVSKHMSTNTVTGGVPRIIPVVVHVIHECGPENISKEQIEDQIRILNEDFRRLNADVVNTPTAFQ